MEIETWKKAYDDDPSVIFLLDADRRIVRCNAAWDRFALSNRGADAATSKVLGTHVMDAVSPSLKDYYATAYHNVQITRRDWWHIYECSSEEFSRVFHMRILACDERHLLVINTLIREAPHAPAQTVPIDHYADSAGIVKMCSHCRRVQRLGELSAWDWIPQLLLVSKALVRFDLCPFCTAYHYHVR